MGATIASRAETRAGALSVRAVVLETIAVLVGYSIAALAVTWPLAADIRNRLLGPFPGDAGGGAAWYDQLHVEGGYHLLGTTHHTLTGAPLGWAQGNALNFQWLLPNYPGYLVAGPLGGTAALNLVILSGLVLSGAAMYLLVRWLGCGRLVAGWAGLVFLVFPWHLQRALAGHATLVHLEVFPLVLLAALAWLRRPSDRGSLLVALAVLAAWLTSGYFGAMALVMLAAISAVAVWRFRAAGFLTAFRRTILLWAPAVLASGFFAVVSIAAGGTEGVRIGRTVGEISYYGAHLRDFLPDPMNPVLGELAVNHLGRTTREFPGAEGSLYPGLLTLALAAAAVILLVRRRLLSTRGSAVAGALVAVAALAVIMAAPSPMRVLGIDMQPMPSRVLLAVLPSFRVPTRFQAVLMTALIPLAALALAQLVARARAGSSSERAGRLIAVGICAAAAAISVTELAVLRMPVQRLGTPPPAYTAVERLKPGVLAEYPLFEPGRFDASEYLFWQRAHGRPLVNAGGAGTEADELRRTLVDPAAPGAAAALARLGVTAIVTRPTTYRWHLGSRADDRASYGPGYELVGAFPGDVRVWRVTAPPAPAVAGYDWDEVEEPGAPDSDGFVGSELKGNRVRLDVYAPRAGVRTLRLDARAAADVRSLRITGRGGSAVVPIRGGRGSVALSVAVPRGRSALVVSAGTAGGGRSAVRLSAPWFEAGARSGQSPVTPFPVSTDPGF
jgi:hypothetical protein